MTPDVEVSREIAAPPELVFASLSDITRMGEWSPECHTCEWQEGWSEAALGARFTGHNRLGENEWTTEAEIVEFEPDRVLGFDCMFRDFVFATWVYRLDATPTGTKVTEQWHDLRPEAAKEVRSAASGVDDRSAHNRAGMEATLERLAAVVE